LVAPVQPVEKLVWSPVTKILYDNLTGKSYFFYGHFPGNVL